MVMSWIWTGMIGLALFFGLVGGAPGLAQAAMTGAGRAVELGISLAGSLCLWSGFAELLRQGGLRDRLGRLLSPLWAGCIPPPGTTRRPWAVSAGM